jgi:glutamate synthase (NADPH) large chain
MSGGVAYVLDLDPGRVNTELIDLAPVEGEPLARLRRLVRRHWEETDSPVAQALLLEWASTRHRFTEVMPRDYRRVLAAQSDAARRGLSETETTAAMMGANDG